MVSRRHHFLVATQYRWILYSIFPIFLIVTEDYKEGYNICIYIIYIYTNNFIHVHIYIFKRPQKIIYIHIYVPLGGGSDESSEVFYSLAICVWGSLFMLMLSQSTANRSFCDCFSFIICTKLKLFRTFIGWKYWNKCETQCSSILCRTGLVLIKSINLFLSWKALISSSMIFIFYHNIF